MTHAGQPPALPGAEAGESAGPDPDAELQNREPPPPPRGWPLWVWPPLAVALIAVAGYRFGIAGAITAAASSVAALVFVAGDFLYSGHHRRASAVLAVALAVILATGLQWQAKVPWIRRPTSVPAAVHGPVNLRGVTITQAQAARLDLRGAVLPGAILDGLSLRGRQLEGITAPGISFRRADLSFASLRGADLNGADFSYACLIGTDFSGALLDGANVSHATLDLHALPGSVVKRLIGVPVRPSAHMTRCPRQ